VAQGGGTDCEPECCCDRAAHEGVAKGGARGAGGEREEEEREEDAVFLGEEGQAEREGGAGEGWEGALGGREGGLEQVGAGETEEGAEEGWTAAGPGDGVGEERVEREGGETEKEEFALDAEGEEGGEAEGREVEEEVSEVPAAAGVGAVEGVVEAQGEGCCWAPLAGGSEVLSVVAGEGGSGWEDGGDDRVGEDDLRIIGGPVRRAQGGEPGEEGEREEQRKLGARIGVEPGEGGGAHG
jgi:hypothetical protein